MELPYSIVRNAVWIFLVAILSSSFIVFFASGAHEQYPFFSWALFQNAPQPIVRENVIRFTHVDGKKLAEPVYTDDAAEILGIVSRNQYIVWEQHLVAAITNRDTEAIRRSRLGFEEVINHPVSYQLVTIEYDTVERWRTGALRSVEVLQSYTSGDEKY